MDTQTLFLKVRERTSDSPLPVEVTAGRQLVSIPRAVSETSAGKVTGELRVSLT